MRLIATFIATLLLTTPLFAEDTNYGLVQPLDWKDKAVFQSLENEKIRIPNDFDWRRLIGNGLQDIRDQSGCGSCWAFAVTAVVESLHILKHGFSSIDLAEQTLVSSCSNSGSCSGGYFNAFDYIQSKGLPDEEEDPYRARNTSCKRSLNPQVKIKNWSYIGSRDRGPTVEEMKKAIYKYGPIAVDVNGNFGSYNGGVYSNCRRGRTNHMVVIEGWNDDEGYWIMRNSWGSNWGEDGYMRIKYTDSNGNKCNNIGMLPPTQSWLISNAYRSCWPRGGGFRTTSPCGLTPGKKFAISIYKRDFSFVLLILVRNTAPNGFVAPFASGEFESMKKNESISTIMTKDPLTATPVSSLREVAEILTENPIHHVPIVEGKKITGIVSYTDLMRVSFVDIYQNDGKPSLQYLDESQKISEIMTKDVQTLNTRALVRDAAKVFAQSSFHSLCIVDDNNNLEGIVTSTDIIQYLLDQF